MITLDQHVGRYEKWTDIPDDVQQAYLLAQCRKYEDALALAASTNVRVNFAYLVHPFTLFSQNVFFQNLLNISLMYNIMMMQMMN